MVYACRHCIFLYRHVHVGAWNLSKKFGRMTLLRRERESTTFKLENVDQVGYEITLLYISIFVNVYKLRTLIFL